MGKQNVTLSLPKDLLRQAKVVAIERNMSLSSLLATTLREIVGRHREYADARHVHETILVEGFDMGLNGEIDWSRDDIHER